MQIIAVSNHKGGVGKTTSVVNIGAGMALKGKKVLLIDCDPQANLSQSLGIEDAEKSIYNALKGEIPLPIVNIEKNLDLTPSNLELVAAEIELAARISRETILKNLIKKVNKNYDYILIDCPPSLGLITINAFAAADSILIPLQAEYLAMRGMDKLVDVITSIKAINPTLSLRGVFITQYDSRKVLNRDITQSVKDAFGEGLIFQSAIRNNVSLAEAPAKNQSIFKYAPSSKGATDYKKLVEELLKK